MPRISITIADELMARLGHVKERVNVSQVCRDALERRIVALEVADKQQDGELELGSLIDRLREEQALVEGKFEDMGRGNAIAWLGTASYLEIKSVVEYHETSDMENYRLPRAAFRTMKQDMKQNSVSCEGGPAVIYKTAWSDFVRAIWDQVITPVEETADATPVEATE